MSGSVLDIARDLIRLDTTNPGSTEERAAEYIADLLTSVGITFEVLEPEPGRCSLIARSVTGQPAGLPPLVLHAHLDTVPVQPDGWSHDPFGADVADGFLWGRGAVDMKVAAAMLVKLQLELARDELRARRDLIVAYFADEEMGGVLGSHWVTTERPDLFAGAEVALGEIGGFNIDLPNGRRAFLIQTAEHGLLWIRIVVRGVGGHAAFRTSDNPLVQAARVVEAIEALKVDEQPLRATQVFEAGLSALISDGGTTPDEVTPLLSLGRNTRFTPTMISAGLKPNVIPDAIELVVDCRFLPGSKEAALDAIRSVLPPEADLEVMSGFDGLESSVDAPVVDALRSVVERRYPESAVLPFVMPGGSDAQKFAAIGIHGYGFTPLVLPPAFPYIEMLHAVNERIPVEAIDHGYALLRDFVQGY
jgi:acetylornithine deacetylase/succinyl-diaminopimelate desuccinylase-like protein